MCQPTRVVLCSIVQIRLNVDSSRVNDSRELAVFIEDEIEEAIQNHIKQIRRCCMSLADSKVSFANLPALV